MRSNVLANYTPLEIQERQIANGSTVRFELYKVPLSLTKACPTNPRFGLENPVTDDEHRRLIAEEDPQRTANLTESFKRMPVTDVPIGHLKSEASQIEMVSGNRRRFSAEAAQLDTILCWVVRDVSEEDLEVIRDYPETNPTKVDHRIYMVEKNIKNVLRRSTSPELREENIVRLKKRYGLGPERILKAERTQERMEAVCQEFGKSPEDLKHQYKGFQAYDSIHENVLNELRFNGEFEKVEMLDKLAKAYLKNGIAHDDIKDTVSILAKTDDSDPLVEEIRSGKRNIQNEDELRKLTQEARLSKDDRSSVIEEFNRTFSRIYSAMIQKPEISTCDDLLQELNAATDKIKALRKQLLA